MIGQKLVIVCYHYLLPTLKLLMFLLENQKVYPILKTKPLKNKSKILRYITKFESLILVSRRRKIKSKFIMLNMLNLFYIVQISFVYVFWSVQHYTSIMLLEKKRQHPIIFIVSRRKVLWNYIWYGKIKKNYILLYKDRWTKNVENYI